MMAITLQAAGVGEYGYTLQAVLVARGLVRNAGTRRQLLELLHRLDKPCTYSNEDFDRTQSAADVLTRIMRENVDTIEAQEISPPAETAKRLADAR